MISITKDKVNENVQDFTFTKSKASNTLTIQKMNGKIENENEVNIILVDDLLHFKES